MLIVAFGIAEPPLRELNEIARDSIQALSGAIASPSPSHAMNSL
jgi:hypothetical protein